MNRRLIAVLLCLMLSFGRTIALAEWNLQEAMTPGFWSQYSTDELLLLKECLDEELASRSYGEKSYVLNTNTLKFHVPTCSSVRKMKESNKKDFSGQREDLILMGYDPCGNCHP